MTLDHTSDMITRIRNANAVHSNQTYINYSKFCISILKILKTENFISNFFISKKKKYLRVLLNYKGFWGKESSFSSIEQVSKPGRRVYIGYKDFINFKRQLNKTKGLLIISTSSGIMTHTKAENLKKGGEILFYID